MGSAEWACTGKKQVVYKCDTQITQYNWKNQPKCKLWPDEQGHSLSSRVGSSASGRMDKVSKKWDLQAVGLGAQQSPSGGVWAWSRMQNSNRDVVGACCKDGDPWGSGQELQMLRKCLRQQFWRTKRSSSKWTGRTNWRVIIRSGKKDDHWRSIRGETHFSLCYWPFCGP